MEEATLLKPEEVSVCKNIVYIVKMLFKFLEIIVMNLL